MMMMMMRRKRRQWTWQGYRRRQPIFQCWGRRSSKGSVVSNQIMTKFGRIVLQANTHQFTESDFQYDVTLSRWRPEKCCYLVSAHASSARHI